jgi:hypothetical protein
LDNNTCSIKVKSIRDKGSRLEQELDQPQEEVFNPVDISTMTQKKRRRCFDVSHREETNLLKARWSTTANPTRRWLSREDAASQPPLESIMLTAIIDAKEGRDVMTADVPNAFVQTNASTKDGEPSDYENHRSVEWIYCGRNGTRFLRSLRCLKGKSALR